MKIKFPRRADGYAVVVDEFSEIGRFSHSDHYMGVWSGSFIDLDGAEWTLAGNSKSELQESIRRCLHGERVLSMRASFDQDGNLVECKMPHRHKCKYAKYA